MDPNMTTKRTIKDLPDDALATLKLVLIDWKRNFPNTPMQEAIDIFVDTYFEQG
jgi:hypothetical protein